MTSSKISRVRRLVTTVVSVVAFITAASVARGADEAADKGGTDKGVTDKGGAAALADKRQELAQRLASSPYKRPLVVESTEAANTVSGDAYAVITAPFSAVSATFKDPRLWCEVLILHLNTKSCRSSGNQLTVHVGRKFAQELSDATELRFAYRLAAASTDYLDTRLNADKGPVGTSNYRIELQAIPMPEGKTFLHLHYSYDYSFASKIALQTYLSTLGSGKIGFTRSGNGYVGGVRGAVERNTMRYYLAIEAYLDSLEKPAAQQLTTRFQYWFDATEEFREQLHEVDRADYLSMKADEHRRQSAAQ